MTIGIFLMLFGAALVILGFAIVLGFTGLMERVKDREAGNFWDTLGIFFTSPLMLVFSGGLIVIGLIVGASGLVIYGP
jgi:hypothetical protein